MKMKIYVFGTLCIIALGMLTGCGVNTDKVKEDIQGYWGYDYYAIAVDEHCHQIYLFDEDSVNSYWINDEAPAANSEHSGTYEIKRGKIIISYTDQDSKDIIEYSYDNDNIQLVDKGSDGSTNNELIKINP